MQTHPFIESVINRIVGITLTIIAWMIYSWLLFCYGGEGMWMACLDGLVSVGLLAIAGFLYGYVDGTIHALQIQIALAVLVQAISLAGAFGLQVFLEQGSAEGFMDSVSLRLVFGILCWIILLQWYRMSRTDEPDFEEIPGIETNEVQEEAVPVEETFLDRVSVKDGSRIHIIHLEELLYLQAGGDYVTLFTPGGQYVKEQTMKYFETHLPPALFVRIHRSCIVNAEQILRVELFGKENYQVRLKNGVCLRASNAGYKLLKERRVGKECRSRWSPYH